MPDAAVFLFLGQGEGMRSTRHDVANRVDVEDAASVRDAVKEILARRYAGASFEALDTAFADFERLYSGRMPGYLACDTLYHDMRHTLEVTLAMARLVDGHDRIAAPGERLGPRRALLGVIAALLHDAGYIREAGDSAARNGAEYTRIHVSRSARYLERYLPSLGLAALVPAAAGVVHFTGYEIALESVPLADPLDRRVGFLLGSADLIGQMSERAYLEKCRDFLYEEFVIAGIAQGTYSSADDLLRKTIGFYETVAMKRLEEIFGGVHRLAGAHFGGRNPYQEAIRGHMAFLRRAVQDDALERLRRTARSLSLQEKKVQEKKP
jgi:hypothetical protein